MSQILISLSAATFAKGDRVIVRAKKNEWYIGTVTRAGVKIGIVFDDGATAQVEKADFKHVHHMNRDRKIIRALDDVSAAKLIAKKNVKEEKVAAVPAATKTDGLIRLSHNRDVKPEAANATLVKAFRKVFPGAVLTKPTKSKSRFGFKSSNLAPTIVHFAFPALMKDPMSSRETLRYCVDLLLPSAEAENENQSSSVRSVQLYGSIDGYGSPLLGDITFRNGVPGNNTRAHVGEVSSLIAALSNTHFMSVREGLDMTKFVGALQKLKAVEPVVTKLLKSLVPKK